MSSARTERAFEEAVEATLGRVGWVSVESDEWDVERALFPERVVKFIRDTQPDEWARMSNLHGIELSEMLVRELVDALEVKGALEVLRHGFKFRGRALRVAYFRPAFGLNPEAVARYDRNELTVTRQARCLPGKNDTVDLLFALNGVPVATCELKNPMTGQNWQHAIRQYRTDREPGAPLFRFGKRALVHFAADPDEIHMTTRLAKGDTRFLPFNRGSHPGEVRCGEGNPPHPSGHRTGYFWGEVLERDRFLDIIGSFMFTERRSEKVTDAKGTRTVKHETLIFPRFHQLDSVSRLVEAARSEGAGHNYLVQHSAGSGKTNSISWLAHRLSSLHTATDDKVFDCVLVITDRRVLDAQLQDAIRQIEQTQGVVKAINENSAQLAKALTDGTEIVITTLQKFPWVMRGLLAAVGALDLDEVSEAEQSEATRLAAQIGDRRYAVIVDEAHSSQSGEAARAMKEILGARSHAARSEAEDGGGWEDGLNAVMESRGPQPNLSFFAFTATPKRKTIELFGRRPGPIAPPRAFHVYSMRQAIEESFILDVLGNYTDYDTYFKLINKAEDDPEFPKRRTATKLAKFLALHEHNLAQKTEIIIEHFRNQVMHAMGGRAKAMVVAGSRLHAVRYMNHITKYVHDHGYDDVRPLVAFSGTVIDPDTGGEYTEPKLNLDVVTGKPISEAALPGRFASPDYQILIVAEKYQTGFDQPLLQAMYVDKRLSGVHAVQTLSRLNRTAAGKQPPFVLDFVNSPADIAAAFAPYFDVTQLAECSDPYQLNELAHELEQAGVYHQSEVDQFASVFYLPVHQQKPNNHALLEAALQPARGRFTDLEEKDQEAFRDRLAAYVRLYTFLSQIIPYADCDLERLYSFGRMLLPRLRTADGPEPIDLGDDIELEYYRIQIVSSGKIEIKPPIPTGGEQSTRHDTAGAATKLDEDEQLSKIISRLNEAHGTRFTEEDRLYLKSIVDEMANNDDLIQVAVANTEEKLRLVAERVIEDIVLDQISDDSRLAPILLDEGDKKPIHDALLDLWKQRPRVISQVHPFAGVTERHSRVASNSHQALP